MKRFKLDSYLIPHMKIKLKMDWGLEYKDRHYKTPRGKEKKLCGIGYIDDFIDMMPKRGNKNKNERVGPRG